MGKNNDLVFIGVIVTLAILLSGGSSNGGGLFSSGPLTPEQKQANIQKQITDTQYKVDELKKQVDAEEAKKTQSIYKDIVEISYINRSTDPNQEYVAIHVAGNATTTIPITGWTIKSLSSGQSFQIPQGTYLFFTGSINTEQNIYLGANDNFYLVTGYSPNGSSFKINKCSGYLTQFQTFVPYIGSQCPAPKNEDLSSIPKTVNNDACFDYIDSMSSCRIQTDPLPPGSTKWGSECTDFIYKKINYPSCVDTHKNDKDFYKNEWRVYLKRSTSVWKNSREDVVLLDQYGKIVDEIKY